MPFHVFTVKIQKAYGIGMDGLRQNGIEALAIPHNSNGSNGQMFKLVDWANSPSGRRMGAEAHPQRALGGDYASQRNIRNTSFAV